MAQFLFNTQAAAALLLSIGDPATAADPARGAGAPGRLSPFALTSAETPPRLSQTDLGAEPAAGANSTPTPPPPPARPAPKRQTSIADGDEAQYERALERPDVPSTDAEADVNQILTLPPETAEATLSLREVLVYTLKNSPDIGILRWQAEDARYAWRAARGEILPQLSFSGAVGLESTYFPQNDSPGPNTLDRDEASLRLRQRIFDFGRTSQNIKRAQALYQSQELQQSDQVDQTLLDAIVAYLDLIAATELLANARENVRAHERIVALVELSFSGGNVSEAELKRAVSRLDRARTEAIDFENRRERAVGQFQRITGLEPGRLRKPSLTLAAAYDLSASNIDAFIADNPAVQAIQRDINSVRHQRKAVGRGTLPEFDVELVAAYQENLLGVESANAQGRAMLKATWNMYDGGATGARKRQLISRERENEQRLVKLRNEIRQDAFNILSVLQTTREKTSIYREQVEVTTRVVDLYAKQFEAGRRTLLELLDAQGELNDARREAIATQYENLAAAAASLRIQNRLTTTVASELNLALPN